MDTTNYPSYLASFSQTLNPSWTSTTTTSATTPASTTATPVSTTTPASPTPASTTYTISSIAAGATMSIPFVTSISSNPPGTALTEVPYTNTATIAFDTQSLAATGTTYIEIETSVPYIYKTVDNTTPKYGDVVSWLISYSNLGNLDSKTITITEAVLPSWQTFVGPINSSQISGWVVSSNNTYSYIDSDPLQPLQTRIIYFKVKITGIPPTYPYIYTNTATLTMTDINNNSNTVTATSNFTISIKQTNLLVYKATRNMTGCTFNNCQPIKSSNNCSAGGCAVTNTYSNQLSKYKYNNCNTSCGVNQNGNNVSNYKIYDIVPWVISITNIGDVPATNVVINESLPDYAIFVGENNWVKLTNMNYQYSIPLITNGSQYSIPFYVKIIKNMNISNFVYQNIATINYNCGSNVSAMSSVVIYCDRDMSLKKINY